MTDSERFEALIHELGQLWLALGDLAEHLVLIGGQVVALESRARGGDGVIAVRTPTGTSVIRGYSFDLDLLYDGNAGWMGERLPEVLRARGFERSKTTRWTKVVGRNRIDLDLLTVTETAEAALPTPMDVAPGSALAARDKQRVAISSGISVAIPSPVAFLELKVAAKAKRPTAHKDCFDIYAFVSLIGPEEIRANGGEIDPHRGGEKVLAGVVLVDEARRRASAGLRV